MVFIILINRLYTLVLLISYNVYPIIKITLSDTININKAACKKESSMLPYVKCFKTSWMHRLFECERLKKDRLYSAYFTFKQTDTITKCHIRNKRFTLR